MGKKSPIKKVVVHPIVLLSVVDHYRRVTKGGNFRVAGVLLGSVNKKTGTVSVKNCFAVPFEEDRKEDGIWFFDKNYVEDMYHMFRKVTTKEMIVGWYSTGPKIRNCDISIHNEILKQFFPNPVYVIVDPKPTSKKIPIKSYIDIEERTDQNKQPTLTFDHIESGIGALEVEEIGVEHLLRGVKDSTVSSLSSNVDRRMQSLNYLADRLKDVVEYLNKVKDGKYPINNQILFLLQDVFNKLPNLKQNNVKQAFISKTNDKMVTMYISTIMRTIVSLHNLINNKLDARDIEKREKEMEKELKLLKKLKKIEELKKEKGKKGEKKVIHPELTPLPEEREFDEPEGQSGPSDESDSDMID